MAEQKNKFETYLELYKQRYDTFRHLDRLRWQMFQIAALTAALVLGFKGSPADLKWYSWVGIGLVFCLLGESSRQIRKGIITNSKVLRKFGKEVGDTNIPEATRRGIAYKIIVVLILAGIACIVTGVVKLIGVLNA